MSRGRLCYSEYSCGNALTDLCLKGIKSNFELGQILGIFCCLNISPGLRDITQAATSGPSIIMLYLVVCVLQPFQNQVLVMHPGEGNSLKGAEGKNEPGGAEGPRECPLSPAQAVLGRHRQRLFLTEVKHTAVNAVLWLRPVCGLSRS